MAGSADPIGRNGLILFDLAMRYRCYWGDSCATIATGRACEEIVERHWRACAAVARARELAVPGPVAGELDREIRALIDFPHHAGHGIGCSVHEAPRIVPSSDTELQSGMVIAIEPGSYSDRHSLRVEQVLLITDSGCELLSRHDIALLTAAHRKADVMAPPRPRRRTRPSPPGQSAA